MSNYLTKVTDHFFLSQFLQREKDRKDNYQGEFVELNKSQEALDIIAADNRERFRSRLRANKKKIEQAKEDRPSLLLRHDQVRDREAVCIC